MGSTCRSQRTELVPFPHQSLHRSSSCLIVISAAARRSTTWQRCRFGVQLPAYISGERFIPETQMYREYLVLGFCFCLGFLVYLAFWGRERSSADGLWFLFHIKQQGKEKSIKTPLSTTRTKSHNRCLYLKYTAWQRRHTYTYTHDRLGN